MRSGGFRFFGILRSYRIWSHLGWRDLKIQFGRSRFASLWSIANLTVSILGLVLAQGIVSGSINFHVAAPKLAISLWIWFFFSSFINECSVLFESERRNLLNSQIDENVYLMKSLWKQVLTCLLSLPLILLIIGYSNGVRLSGLPKLTVIMVALSITVLLPGLVLARMSVVWPNLKGFVAPAVQMMFFFSPILWTPNPEINLSIAAVNVNPLAWMIVSAQNSVSFASSTKDYVFRSVCLAAVSIIAYAFTIQHLPSIKNRL